MTNPLIKKEEFRWSFQKKGKQVFNICTRLLFVAGLASLTTGVPKAALANPTGGTIVGGTATITTTPTELQINQSSQNTVINWNSFNIAKGETTHFYQPSTSAVALNRVVNSQQISTINGNLLANGHVLIINPNGVLIGPSGNVDTAGFIATSADIANDAFMSGNGKLDFNIAGSARASVVNQGTITVEGEGLAALVAPTVSNDGVIQGNLSKIQFGAADTFGVDLYGDGLLSLGVGSNGAARTLTAENAGSIIASGGKVLMTAAAANDVVNSVINNTGVVQAQSLVNHNGQIILTGAGANVTDSGKLDVSGANGGGDIKVGGDAQGSGTLAHAATVNVASGAVLNASAIDNGNGGNIVVWSDNGTAFHGTALATGGQNGGNGGKVETSSPVNLYVSGSSVDTLAPKGTAGDWLLDPNSVTIEKSGATGTDINVSDINNAKTNVTIQADNKITFNADVNMGYAGVGLTAKAGTAGSDWEDLTAGTGTISLANHYIRTYGGYVTFESGNTISVSNATIYTRGGAFSLIGGSVNVESTLIGTVGGAANFTTYYKANTEAHDCGDHNSDDTGTDGILTMQNVKLNTSGGTGTGGIDITQNYGNSFWQGTPMQLASSFGNNNKFYTSSNAGTVTISSPAIRESNNNCIAAGGTTCGVSDPVPVTDLTITALDQTKTYGQTFNFDGSPSEFKVTGLVQGDSVTGATLTSKGSAATAGVGSSPYAISISDAIGSLGFGNYHFTYVNGQLTIDPAKLVITADNQSMTYGDTLPTFTASYKGFVNGETASSLTTPPTVAPTTTASDYSTSKHLDANSYTLTATGAVDSNYSITYVDGTLNVAPRALTASISDGTSVYGDTVTLGTVGTFGNIVTGDVVNASGTVSLTGAKYSTSKNLDAGTYGETVSGAITGADALNYTFGGATGSYKVTPRALTITANNDNKTYDGLAYSGGKGVSYNGFVTGEGASVLGGTLAYGGTSQGAVNHGTYGITASGLTDSNYDITYKPGTLTVDQAALTITADDEHMMYGGSAPTLGVSYSGFVKGETAANLTTQPTVTSGTPFTSHAGTYKDTLTASGAVDANYTISYIPGTLTIYPAQTQNFVSEIYGANLQIGPLQRPIISVADRTINYDPPFEPRPTQAGDIILSIGGSGGSGVSLAENMANITPAAGGNDNPADLANITPAAGGNAAHAQVNYNEFACATDFLEGRENCSNNENVK